jgi:hypothetical protein
LSSATFNFSIHFVSPMLPGVLIRRNHSNQCLHGSQPVLAALQTMFDALLLYCVFTLISSVLAQPQGEA